MLVGLTRMVLWRAQVQMQESSRAGLAALQVRPLPSPRRPLPYRRHTRAHSPMR
jgi:hypothetical protein